MAMLMPFPPDEKFDSAEQLENQEVSHMTLEEVQTFPLDAQVVQQSTLKDATLQTVSKWIQQGWPKEKPKDIELQQFWNQQESLTLHDNIVLLQRETNSRVVVPKALQPTVLETLHSSHWGVVKVKQLARRYVWWVSLNSDIEQITKSCDTCRQLASVPPQQYTEWPRTHLPWERVHLDFAGPFRGKMWLICIDAHSKFPYAGALDVGQTTTQQTVQVLKDIFSLEGLPKTLVTDNGPQFSSKDFEIFCNQNGIQHITSPAYHPPSNGEAERFVQSFKKSVGKNCVGGIPLKDSVRLTLATYRSLPHPSLSWKTPAEVLHGRQPRCLLTLLNPVNNSTPSQTRDNPNTSFAVDSLVYARNYSTGPKWLPGKIVSKVGSTIFMVSTDKGLWKRHSNQLQVRLDINNSPNVTAQPSSELVPPVDTLPVLRRYPVRIRKAPERYKP